MTPTVTFACSICGEPSQTICVYCTKDACANHLCERCHRCSDCCECEVRLEEPLEHEHPVTAAEPEPVVAEALFVEELAAAEPAAVVETAVLEEVVAAEPAPSEPPAAEEQFPAPEPDVPAVPPPAPSHPDLSKLFAPEHTPSRVFPTSHGPVPMSNNPPVESSDQDESSEDESGA